MSRRAWIEAAQRVLAGERNGILCPVNGDGDLLVDWVPSETAIGGEFRLACPACGETNFVLVRGDGPTHVEVTGAFSTGDVERVADVLRRWIGDRSAEAPSSISVEDFTLEVDGIDIHLYDTSQEGQSELLLECHLDRHAALSEADLPRLIDLLRSEGIKGSIDYCKVDESGKPAGEEQRLST